MLLRRFTVLFSRISNVFKSDVLPAVVALFPLALTGVLLAWRNLCQSPSPELYPLVWGVVAAAGTAAFVVGVCLGSILRMRWERIPRSYAFVLSLLPLFLALLPGSDTLWCGCLHVGAVALFGGIYVAVSDVWHSARAWWLVAAAMLLFSSSVFWVGTPPGNPSRRVGLRIDGESAAALALGQRPWAEQILLLGDIPLSTAGAIADMRRDCTILWCPGIITGETENFEYLLKENRGLRRTTVYSPEAPEALLSSLEPYVYDVIMVVPPPFHTSEGAAWLQADGPLARIRKIAQSNSPVCVYLNLSDHDTLPEAEGVLLGSVLASLRTVFPEDEVIAAGNGGWWVGARTPQRLRDEAGAWRALGLLKQTVLSKESFDRLWNGVRLSRWQERIPFVSREPDVVESPPAAFEEGVVLRQGWAAYLERVAGWRLFREEIRFLYDFPIRLTFYFFILAVVGVASIGMGGIREKEGIRFLWMAETAEGAVVGVVAVLFAGWGYDASTILFASSVVISGSLLGFLLRFTWIQTGWAGVLSALGGFAVGTFGSVFFLICSVPPGRIFAGFVALWVGFLLLSLGRKNPGWALAGAFLGLGLLLARLSEIW